MHTSRLRLAALAVAAATVVSTALAATPAYAAEVTISGTVTAEASGLPVPGACVTAYATGQTPAGTVCADSAGHYSLAGLPSGQYKLRAVADGFHDLWSGLRPSYAEAFAYPVEGSDAATVNFKLFTGSGRVTGSVVDVFGQPMTDMLVWLYQPGTSQGTPSAWQTTTRTAADGRYDFPDVRPGQYIVRVSDPRGDAQWIPQRGSADAGRYDVVDGQVLNLGAEVFVARSAVEVTVREKTTDRVLAGVCVQIVADQTFHRNGCTDAAGRLLIGELVGTTADISVTDPTGAHYGAEVRGLRLEAYRITKATLVLDPAASLVTSAVDAATGAVVGGVCVTVSRPGDHGVRTSDSFSSDRDQRIFCSGEDGRLVVGPMEPGPVTLLARPNDPYGAQWVRAQGGTGDQRLATTFTAKRGTSAPVGAIRLDRGGAITGLIRDRETGQLIKSQFTGWQHEICAFPFADDMIGTLGMSAGCADANGRYTISGLGPYQWPVEFLSTQRAYAPGWSGDAAHRLAARFTQVTAGKTAALDVTLTPRTWSLRGQVTDPAGNPATEVSLIEAFDAVTGDMVARDGLYTGDDGSRMAYTFGLPLDRPLTLVYSSATRSCAYHLPRGRAVTLRSTKPTELTGLRFLWREGCPQPTGVTVRRVSGAAVAGGMLRAVLPGLRATTDTPSATAVAAQGRRVAQAVAAVVAGARQSTAGR